MGERPCALAAAAEQLRDPEVEELDLPAARHEDVRGLQVAVHDEAPVRVVDRGADAEKELDPPRHRETVRVAVFPDRRPFDVLHREERKAVGRHAAVEESRDPRMLETGEDLALGEKEADGLVPGESEARDLERDTLLELPVAAHAQEDGAHSADSETPDDAKGAELSSDPSLERTFAFLEEAREESGRAAVERGGRPGVGREESSDAGGELAVAAARLRDVAVAFLRTADRRRSGRSRARGARVRRSSRRGRGEYGEEERSRGPPVAPHGGRRSRERFGRPLHGQTPEKPQLDDTREALVRALQLLERGVDREQLGRVRLHLGGDVLERRERAARAPLQCRVMARVVDQDLAHRAGGEREEVPPIPHGNAAGELEVSLVQQRRRAQRFAGPRLPDLDVRELVQLGVRD